MWVIKLNWVLPDPQIIRGIHPVILQGLTTSGCHCLSTRVGLCLFRRPLRLPRLRLRLKVRRRPRLLTYRLRRPRRKDLLDLLLRSLHGLRRRRPQRRRLHRPHHHAVAPAQGPAGAGRAGRALGGPPGPSGPPRLGWSSPGGGLGGPALGKRGAMLTRCPTTSPHPQKAACE